MQGRTSRYPFDNVGDRGLMFRDYLVLQVGLSLECGAQSQISLAMTYARFRGSRSPIPFPSHSPFISFLWPPLKHHDQLIHVPIDFNTPGSRLLAAFNSQLPFYHVLSIEEKSVE